MKRGTKCIARTINLSNPGTCVRPKVVRKLVSADTMNPCPSSAGGSTSYWTPRPVAIKVCTRKDTMRACPPKLCDCPQKAPAKSFAQKVCGALLFLVKGGIAAGLVYWTKSEGLWGTGAETEDLYRRILATITNVNDPSLPHLEGIKYSLIECYNDAVLKLMDTIVGVPIRLHARLRDDLFSHNEEKEKESTGSEDLMEARVQN